MFGKGRKGGEQQQESERPSWNEVPVAFAAASAPAAPSYQDYEENLEGGKLLPQAHGVQVVSDGPEWDGPVAVEASAELVEMMNRMAFVRKVYCILEVQLLLTSGFSALCMYNDSVRTFIAGNAFVLYGSIGLGLVTFFVLMCYRKQSPANMWLLSAWTFLEAVSIGVITASYASAGMRPLVLEAFLITAFVFMALTLLTFQTRIDFSFLGGFLFCGLLVLMVWGVISAVMGVSAGLGYAALGALIFCGYILYDTSLILEKLETDEVILGAITLYLDIINLFLFILDILARSNRRN